MNALPQSSPASNKIPLISMKNIKIGELRHRSTHQQFRRIFVARSNGSVEKDKEKITDSAETPGSSLKNFENCFLVKGYMLDIDDELQSYKHKTQHGQIQKNSIIQPNISMQGPPNATQGIMATPGVLSQPSSDLKGYAEKVSTRVSLYKPQIDNCVRVQHTNPFAPDYNSSEFIKKAYTAPKRQFFPAISSESCENAKIRREQRYMIENREIMGIKKIGITNLRTSINFERSKKRDSKDYMLDTGDQQIPVIKSCS
jgi:hypothetical protein